MARRSRQAEDLPDFSLWHDVARTLKPLHPGRSLPQEERPLPIPEAAQAPSVSRGGVSWQPDPEPFRSPFPDLPAPARKRGGDPIEPGLKKRLVRGRIALDGRIDLHGMRQDEARAALGRFIPARVAKGDRTVLVITGKGLKKGDDAAVIFDRGVLRSMLPVWLSEPALAPLVSGWDQAAQAHGGEGAFYVRLRREREL